MNVFVSIFLALLLFVGFITLTEAIFTPSAIIYFFCLDRSVWDGYKKCDAYRGAPVMDTTLDEHSISKLNYEHRLLWPDDKYHYGESFDYDPNRMYNVKFPGGDYVLMLNDEQLVSSYFITRKMYKLALWKIKRNNNH